MYNYVSEISPLSRREALLALGKNRLLEAQVCSTTLTETLSQKAVRVPFSAQKVNNMQLKLQNRAHSLVVER